MKEENKTEWYDIVFPGLAFTLVLAVPAVWVLTHIAYSGV